MLATFSEWLSSQCINYVNVPVMPYFCFKWHIDFSCYFSFFDALCIITNSRFKCKKFCVGWTDMRMIFIDLSFMNIVLSKRTSLFINVHSDVKESFAVNRCGLYTFQVNQNLNTLNMIEDLFKHLNIN